MRESSLIYSHGKVQVLFSGVAAPEFFIFGHILVTQKEAESPRS
jgi:hypothetical protein